MSISHSVWMTGESAKKDNILGQLLTLNRTPLVDTVYRPHLVHHIALPQEIKAQQIRSRSKRYFSAD